MQPGSELSPGFDDFSSQSFSKHLREYKKKNKKRQHLFHKGIRYASRAEVSCVKALEKYCGWESVEGKTYQVPIGHGKYCDFRVGDVLIEFHPIILSRALHGPSYKLLQDALRHTKEATRRDLRAAIRTHLFIEYAEKRLWSIRLNPDPAIKDSELIVVPGSRDFYRDVVKRFAINRLPREKDFVRMFKEGSFK